MRGQHKNCFLFVDVRNTNALTENEREKERESDTEKMLAQAQLLPQHYEN